MAAPLVGSAGQLPKLDVFFLLRRFLVTGGLLLDTKVGCCSTAPPVPPNHTHTHTQSPSAQDTTGMHLESQQRLKLIDL